LTCTVSFKASIRVSKAEAGRLSKTLREIYGHEQKHVESRTRLVRKKFVDGNSGLPSRFSYDRFCQFMNESRERDWPKTLDFYLDNTQNHWPEDAPFADKDSPRAGVGYPPLDGTPDWPGLHESGSSAED